MSTTNRLRNFDLSTLRSFVAIAESGSMTRAAARLFMTQSAISMQIKRLETSLDLSVFERSAQGMKPTTAGEQLLHFARQMLELNDEAWGRLTSPDYEGQVRLGVPACFGRSARFGVSACAGVSVSRCWREFRHHRVCDLMLGGRRSSVFRLDSVFRCVVEIRCVGLLRHALGVWCYGVSVSMA